MRRLFASPLLYLILGLALSCWQAAASHRLRPQLTADSNSYIVLTEASSPYEALSGLRTYGYPLFLDLARPLGEEWRWVPEIHLAIYAAAVLLFWLAVARFARSGWLALAAALPLCFACALVYLPQIGPDVLAMALALAAVASLLLLATRPRSPALWLLLGATVVGAWSSKPVYLFLVVLVPLLGAALRLCHVARRDSLRLGRLTAGLAALTFVPLLLFGGVRWWVVGQFGVGALGGYNLLGVAACFLSDELVEEIPGEERRWLANEILKGRKMRKWRPMTIDSPISTYHLQHTPNIFRIAEPKVTQLILHRRGGEVGGAESDPMDIPGVVGSASLEIDRELRDLARSIIRRRPLLYLKWVHEGIRYGLGTIFACGWERLLFGLLLLSLPLAAVRVARDPEILHRAGTARGAPLLGIGLVGIVYFLGQLAIVVLVHYLKQRYAMAATLLVPSVLAAALFETWRTVLPRSSG